MKMKLFRYGYLIRIAFDHGRFLPIIIKQRGVSKLLAGISSQNIEMPGSVWTFLQNLEMSFANILLVIIPNWLSKLTLINLY